MAAADSNNDPSMEEILQSIKRIISEESSEEAATNSANSDDDNILELTEIVDEPDEATAVAESEGDFMQEFDSVLTEEMEESPAQEEPAADNRRAPADDFDSEVAAVQEEDPFDAIVDDASAEETVDEEINFESTFEVEGSEDSFDSVQEPEYAESESSASTEEEDNSEYLVADEVVQSSSQAVRELMNKFGSKKREGSDNLHFRSGTTVEDLVAEIMRPMLKQWLNEHLEEMVKTIVEREVKRIIPE